MTDMPETQASSERRFCTFYLGAERYGIDILTVREINRHVMVTLAHGAPDCVRGLMNLRGQIVTVIDPAVRLGYEPRVLDKTTRLVILKTSAELEGAHHREVATGDDLVALCVDRISDVISVPEGRLDPPPPDAQGRGERLLEGVAQLEGEVVRIVDPGALVRLDENG